jgi:small-conductance mechanosensitive channel
MSEQLVSTGTAATLLVGLVIAIVYVRYMWGALSRAVRTRDEVDDGQDSYRHSLVGALIAVVGSALAISAFGLGPALLYLGPGLALLSAVAVARCLRTEYVDE